MCNKKPEFCNECEAGLMALQFEGFEIGEYQGLIDAGQHVFAAIDLVDVDWNNTSHARQYWSNLYDHWSDHV